MKSLSHPDDPSISKRVRKKMIAAALTGAGLAYLCILLAAVIAKELLK